MKNLKKALCLLLAALMTVSLLAGCGSKKDDSGKKVFIQGIDAEYPPFSYLDSDGSYAGFDVEVCKAACDLLGWDMQVFPVNWDQKLVQLDANECDCVWSGMTILDSMKEAGYVLSAPTMTTPRSSWSRRAATSSPPLIWPARSWLSSWAPPARRCWPMAATWLI